MTRINVIPPSELSKPHLLAEYRELPRISNLARNCTDAPDDYVLGAGHVKFFYDKGLFLKKRFDSIVENMLERNMKPQFTEYRPHPPGLNNDYIPTENAIKINRERIAIRTKESEEKRRLKNAIRK